MGRTRVDPASRRFVATLRETGTFAFAALGPGSGGEERFRRGGFNLDGGRDLAGAVDLLFHLFVRPAAPACLDAGDANDDGALHVADAIAVLRHLFAAGGQQAALSAGCAADASGDRLDCAEYPLCR